MNEDGRITEESLNQPDQPLQEIDKTQAAQLDAQEVKVIPQNAIRPAQPNGEYIKEGELDSKAREMKQVLDAQPKVQTMIPLGIGEKAPAWQYVSINGYFMWIQKGVFVDVPRQVAELLAESLNLTYAAGRQALADSNTAKEDALT